MTRDKHGLTAHDYETAIRVLVHSKMVEKWARGEAEAFGVSLDTPNGRRFFQEKCREQAGRLIK